MTQDNDDIDWSVTTWAGAKREQVRQWLKLTVRERLQAVEEMGRVAEALQPSRAAQTGVEDTSDRT